MRDIQKWVRSVRGLAVLAAVFTALGGAVPARADGPLLSVATLSLGSNVRAHEVLVEGNFAYVGTGTGLRIVDISNPSAPALRGVLSTGGKVFGLALRGTTLFMANHGRDLRIVDVSDPDAPTLIGFKSIASYAWDVALKDHILYVATLGGEIFAFNVTNAASPTLVKTIGIPAWSSAGTDATNLAKLRNGVTSGGAKVTGLSVVGNRMFTVDWNYGNIYVFDVTNPVSPVFLGAHYAPFTFRVEGDPGLETAYSLAAFGNSSGIYSVSLATLGPTFRTRHNTCSGCDFFQSPATDYGGLTVSPNGQYVVYVAGKVGEVRVLNVSNPADISSAGVIGLGQFGVQTGNTLGVDIKGDHIFVAAGLLGFRVFSFQGLSD
jgi:hypothetical protein